MSLVFPPKYVECTSDVPDGLSCVTKRVGVSSQKHLHRALGGERERECGADDERAPGSVDSDAVGLFNVAAAEVGRIHERPTLSGSASR